jgi:hypothetical protein
MGGPPGGMVPAGAGPAPMRGAHGPTGTTRNPMMVALLSLCFVYGIFAFLGMVKELKAYRQKDDISIIMFFIPVLGILELLKMVEKIQETKQMAGCQKPAASVVMYLLIAFGVGFYFMADDLNDIWQASGGAPQLGAPGA